MLILSRVCAEFRDKSGQTIFEISPNKRNSFLDAPEAIQEDPLFSMMLADGSLEAAHSVAQRRSLENDPLAGTNAEGRKVAKAGPAADVALDFVSDESPVKRENPDPADPVSHGNDQARKGAKS